MSAPLLRINIHEHAGTIVLNRPEKRNALSRSLLGELSQALADLHLERRVRAVILTGAGPAFCAGMDLNEMRETSRQESPTCSGTKMRCSTATCWRRCGGFPSR